MRKIYHLLAQKHWTKKEKDRWLAQKGLGLAMLAGLMYLFVNGIMSAMNETYLMSLTVHLGKRFMP